MDHQTNSFSSFFFQLLAGFAVAIIFISIVGVFLGDKGIGVSTMYRLGAQGLPYDTMIQILLSIVVILCMKMLLFSNLIFKRLLVLWRTVLLLIAGLLIMGSFSVAFGWIPADSPDAWFGMIASYFISIGICIALMIISTKRKDKKYNRLLSDYKAKQRNESEELL